MFLLTITPASIATRVWSNFTRSISGLGTALNFTSGLNQTLLSLATQSIQPPPGTARMMSLQVTAGAAGAVSINLFDGTTTILWQSVAGGQSARMVINIHRNCYVTLTNNDAVNSAFFSWIGNDLIQ